MARDRASARALSSGSDRALLRRRGLCAVGSADVAGIARETSSLSGLAAPGLQRFINRITLFLSFVGLTTLLVGGVGVSNAVESYLDGKVRTIATLNVWVHRALLFSVHTFSKFWFWLEAVF